MVRFARTSTTLLALTTAIANAPTSSALDIIEDLWDNIQIGKRGQGTACGYYGTLTCGAGQYCYTDPSNGWAECGYTSTPAASAATYAAAAGTTEYQMYTTTYVETDLQTVTSTYSSAVSVATAAVTSTAASTCKASLGETQCGDQCCGVGTFCVQDQNYCAGTGGGSSAYYSSFYTYTTKSASLSAPARGTTVVGVTVTSTGSATTTSSGTAVPFGTPVSTGGSSVTVSKQSSGGGLSGGAIAGIVIGVIVGLIILFLICLCCCAAAGLGALIDGFLALFGLGKRRREREETTYIEERRHHRGSGAAAAGAGAGAVESRRTWFGMGPQRRTTEVVEEDRRKSRTGGWGGAAAVAGGLGALAIILGLKRKRDARDDKAETDYTYSYYSDYTSESESQPTYHN